MSIRKPDPPTNWLSGDKLRDERSASRCMFLRPQMNISIVPVEVEEKVSALDIHADKPKQTRMAEMVSGRPMMVLACLSPEMHVSEMSNMPEHIQQQVPFGLLTTTLDVCRMCPFHAAPTKDNKKKFWDYLQAIQPKSEPDKPEESTIESQKNEVKEDGTQDATVAVKGISMGSETTL